MNMKIAMMPVGLIGLSLVAGCSEQRLYVPMSHHTIGIAEHQETDVLWVQDNHGSLFRCSNTQQGPKCAHVQP